MPKITNLITNSVHLSLQIYLSLEPLSCPRNCCIILFSWYYRHFPSLSSMETLTFLQNSALLLHEVLTKDSSADFPKSWTELCLSRVYSVHLCSHLTLSPYIQFRVDIVGRIIVLKAVHIPIPRSYECYFLLCFVNKGNAPYKRKSIGLPGWVQSTHPSP